MDNPLIDEFRRAPNLSGVWLPAEVEGYYNAKKRLIERYGFPLVTDEAAEIIARWSPLIEVGAGTGYLAWLLRQAGGVVDAHDLVCDETSEYRQMVGAYHPVSAKPVVFATPEIRTLLISWPCYDQPWAHQTLTAYLDAGGKRLVYIGEGHGGCTADDAFHELIDAQMMENCVIEIPQWYGLHDRVMLYERTE